MFFGIRGDAPDMTLCNLMWPLKPSVRNLQIEQRAVPLYPSAPAILLNNESAAIIHRGRDILASLVMSFFIKPTFFPSDLDRITGIVIYSGIVLACNR
jgi:hypothetical protein